jgi:aminopeptidase-like protein
MKDLGIEMYNLLKLLFPINRSLTGNGNRETLKILSEHFPLKIYEIESGNKVFDWEIPQEWEINEAYIKDLKGNTIIDFRNNNLHVVGYSIPFSGRISKNDLEKHLFSIESQPDAIPYVTSYYNRTWGFCLKHSDRINLNDDYYDVFIDSKLFNGSMTYADFIIPGASKEEVVFSSYICHPSMASNELSGPVVLTYLVKWLQSQRHLNYTYRFIFAPETIGVITYLSQNLQTLKKYVKAGFVITCVGDDLEYSMVASRYGNTYADKISSCILKGYENSKQYSFLERGSDERQFGFPGVDLPFVTLSRTKFYEYEQYHTSLDDLNFTSPIALENSLKCLISHIQLVEKNCNPVINTICEPRLGIRNLYPNISLKTSNEAVKNLMNVITYCDGKNDIMDISNITNIPWQDVTEIIKTLREHNLLK